MEDQRHIRLNKLEIYSLNMSFTGGNEMYKYEVIVWWSEKDQACIAEVPELPGCMSNGGTYEKAFKNVQLIISEWIETAKELGREIPEPKGKLMYA